MRKMRVLLIELTILSFAFAQTALADPTNRYVVKDNPTPLSPFTNWADAAANIQDAINASYASDTIWVSNGVYDVGGVTNYPSGTILTNRVAINKAITVRSTNGPAVTTIKGAWDPTTTNGAAAARCVYMVNGSSLIGFTLTNGATLRTNESAQLNDLYGGGVWCPSVNPIISNCVIAGNSAMSQGGGAWGGTMYNCTLSGNSASDGGGAWGGTMYNCTLSGNSASYGGGARESTMYNCTIAGNSAAYGGGAWGGTMYNCTIAGNSSTWSGGGTEYGTLYNCTIASNSAVWSGGGAQYGILYNCLLTGNSAQRYGGGAYGDDLYNCTLSGNSATSWEGKGGGAQYGTLYNCIIYFNTAPDGTNWYDLISFTNSCTTTAQVGWATGNITNDPLFIANGSGYGTNHIAGNYRLSENSPCLNAGTNFAWMTDTNDVRSRDLDGNPRIRHGTVDMGAYETLLKGTIFYVR